MTLSPLAGIRHVARAGVRRVLRVGGRASARAGPRPRYGLERRQPGLVILTSLELGRVHYVLYGLNILT